MNMTDYLQFIGADKVNITMSELQEAQEDVLQAAKVRHESYQNKAELMKQKTQLETAIKLTESEALMNTEFIGKDQFGTLDGHRIPLNNDTNRNTFRRMASKYERIQLGEVTAELARIDVEFAKANDDWQAAIERAAVIKAKAAIQNKLLGLIERAAV